MGDCFEFLKNNTLSRAGLNGENGTARNVHYGDILIKFGDCLDGERSDLPFITDDTVLPKFTGSILREGDVIFADTAEDEAAGKCVELRKLPKEPTISGLHTIPARPRFPFGTGYLGHYLNSDAYHRQLLPLMQGIKVISVSKASLQDTQVRFPGLSEQTAIGAALSEIDALITLHQRKRKYRGLYGYLSWEQRKLGDMGTTYGGLTGKSKEDFGHGAAWFVPYTNVFDNPVGDSTRLERVEIDPSQNVVRRGDALFTVSSETPEEVGMSSVWPSDLDDLYLNSFCFGYRQDGSFDPSYLAYMLRADSFRNQIEMLAQGISRFNISKGKVMEIEVPVPNKREQARIGRLFVDLDSLITLHQ